MNVRGVEQRQPEAGGDGAASLAKPLKAAKSAGSRGARDARPAASLAPIRAGDFGYDQARHLLWRAGFGGTPQQIQTLASWGPERSVDYLLNAERVADTSRAGEFDKGIMQPPSAAERAAYAEARRKGDEEALAKFRQMREQMQRNDRMQINQMQKWWLAKMIETSRPLEEKLTLFWHGHFATSYRTVENSYHMYLQNDLFRRHAAGNFAELLFGIIRDPAMIAYLDNNDSRKGRANENLAREIMELFALGIGRYSERDIKEGARALTGYTFRDDAFYFDKANHDDGAKTILGKSGKLDGDDFVKAILEQRACSAFICRKLYSFFVADLPPLERAGGETDGAAGPVVAQMASTMLANKYEIKPVLRRLFLSEHFYHRTIMAQQIKSPALLVVGAVRSLNTPARDLSILNDALDLMGQNLLFPPSVKGWDGGRSWINTSTFYVRQNILAYLLTGKKPVGYDASADTQKYDPRPLLDELAKADPGAERNPERVVEYLLRLTVGRAPESGRAALTAFIDSHGGRLDGDNARDLLLGILLLITAMPEYQLC